MNPKCRFCGALPERQTVKGRHVFGGGDNQHFWQCDDCRMIYLFPPLSDAEEKRFYRREFEKFMADRSGQDKDWSSPEKHFQTNKQEVKRRLPVLKPLIKKGATVLEIGCSSGFMLSALKDLGADVLGIDPSEGFIDYVKAKGIPVYKDIEELLRLHSVRFDLIIHYYVLEHIREPAQFISDYMNLLNNGGTMVFEVPCASDPLIELYKVPAFDKFYWSVAHHWYFNRESLSAVLKETGYPFQLFPEQRYDLSNHLIWMLEGRPGGAGKYIDIFGHELDRLYKERLKERWLCDTIGAIVEKSGRH